MKLEAIQQVLTFQAFRPDPDDPNTALAPRMAGRRYLCVNVSRGKVSWRGVDRKGQFSMAGQADGELGEVLASGVVEEWQSSTDGGWVALSVNNRFIVTLEANLSRKPGSESLIRSNARSIIGAKYDRTKKYAVHHHPETNGSLMLACEDSLVRTIEDSLEGAGFKVARVCCGLFSMVVDYLRRQAQVVGPKRDFVLVACCEGSVCVLVQKKGQWSELRARSGIGGGDDAEPVLGLAGPLLGGAGAGLPIVLVHDQIGTMLRRALLEKLEPHGAVDVTQQDHLWMAMTQS